MKHKFPDLYPLTQKSRQAHGQPDFLDKDWCILFLENFPLCGRFFSLKIASPERNILERQGCWKPEDTQFCPANLHATVDFLLGHEDKRFHGDVLAGEEAQAH